MSRAESARRAAAYPMLVAALRAIVDGWRAIPKDDPVPETLNDGRVDEAAALLVELGELPQ